MNWTASHAHTGTVLKCWGLVTSGGRSGCVRPEILNGRGGVGAVQPLDSNTMSLQNTLLICFISIKWWSDFPRLPQ
eukprot:1382656-Amphidinium_carterae.1